MSSVVVRSITGLFFVLLVAGSLILDFYAFLIVFGIFALIGNDEFIKLSNLSRAQVQRKLSTFFSAVVFFSVCLIPTDWLPHTAWLAFIPVSFLILIVELFRKKENPVLNISVLVFGIIYTVVPLALISFLLYPPFHAEYYPWFAIKILILIWVNDTMAYVVGKLLGKHKLFERISPGKTWEGFFGGALFCIAAAYFINQSDIYLSFFDWMLLALIVIVAGTLGDLAESMLKRSVNVKDSGNILPGHGGVLDRFDAVLITIPVITAYLYLKYS